MKKKCLIFLASTIFLSCNQKWNSNCPDTLLKDFNQKIESKTEAEKIFMSFFTENKGFPPFNKSEVKIDDSPSCSGSNKTCYFYYGWYGMGPDGVGGYLYHDGKLVKRGYCK